MKWVAGGVVVLLLIFSLRGAVALDAAGCAETPLSLVLSGAVPLSFDEDRYCSFYVFGTFVACADVPFGADSVLSGSGACISTLRGPVPEAAVVDGWRPGAGLQSSSSAFSLAPPAGAVRGGLSGLLAGAAGPDDASLWADGFSAAEMPVELVIDASPGLFAIATKKQLAAKNTTNYSLESTKK